MTLIRDPNALADAIDVILALPRTQRPAAAAELAERVSLSASAEAWNTRFGPKSLYAAWSETRLVAGLYAANAEWLRQHLKPGWRVIEVGGGDGRLWSMLRNVATPGELVLVDPVADTHAELAKRLPQGVDLVSIERLVEDVLAELPEADAVVCSLTLHHLAGRDADERQRFGLDGVGKREVLTTFRDCIRPRGGGLLLNEADIYCEIDLPPGDPVLADRLFDSYVRRTARALCREIRAGRGDVSRLACIVHRWCLQQVGLADAALEDRDVYELDVPQWLALLQRSGLSVIDRRFTDEEARFCLYVCR